MLNMSKNVLCYVGMKHSFMYDRQFVLHCVATLSPK